LLVFWLSLSLCSGLVMDWTWVIYETPSAVLWLGVVVGFCSAFGLVWVHVELGLNWSPFVEVQESHSVSDKGPYAIVRHPMYSVFFLTVVALGIWMQNVIGWVALVGCWFIVGPGRAHREERLLLDSLGVPYQEYLERVPDRFFPGDRFLLGCCCKVESPQSSPPLESMETAGLL